MNTSLERKVALVCGASKGIGKAIAVELAQLGAHVLLMARSKDQLEEVKARLDTSRGQHHYAFEVDLTDRVGLKVIVDRILTHAKVHILINNTGGPPSGPIIKASEDDFVKALGMHVGASQLLVKALLPGMIEDDYGRIINIVSTSVKAPIPGLGVSNTTRGAMASWSKTLAGELGVYGITVNNVLPGFTATGRLESIINTRAEKQGISTEEVTKGMKTTVPLGRFADPSEIAAVAAFLASPAASYVTGTSIRVDGGRTKSI